MAKWILVGVVSVGINLSLLAGLVDRLNWPVPLASAVVAIVGAILRFLANDRLVFGHPRPAWPRFRAYCAAAAGGTSLGYAVLNALVWAGVHYLVSAILTTACSFVVNLTTNFLWVWRRRPPPAGPAIRPGETSPTAAPAREKSRRVRASMERDRTIPPPP